MKSKAIASEKTPAFYVRLKRSRIVKWYLDYLGPKAYKHRLALNQLNRNFQIKQIAFYHKHVWYQFLSRNKRGWLPLKFIRKNYCRLAISSLSDQRNLSSYLTVFLMTCYYQAPRVSKASVTKLIRQYRLGHRTQPQSFARPMINLIGRFKNLSNGSLRRIRNQLLRCCPVILWILKSGTLQAIVLTGFNRRCFYYYDPLTEKFNVISRKTLLKLWRGTGYQAISC